MNNCPSPSDNLGLVRSVMGAVDCNVRTYSQSGYLALTGPHSFFPAALTSLLTLYVALLGFQLLFGLGRSRLSDAPVMALKIGVILALTLNWASFQTLVFDMANRAPVEIARIISDPAIHSGSRLAADPVAGLQAIYDELTLDVAAFSPKTGPTAQPLQTPNAEVVNRLLNAQSSLLMASIGLVAIASILAGVLVAIGPIFIALFLFVETRGLFVGWLRALITSMIVPIAGWMTTTILLVVAEPWLLHLAQTRQAGSPDVDGASVLSTIILIFSAAQIALTIGAAMIAGGFQLNLVSKSRPADTVSEPGRREYRAPFSRAEQLAINLGPRRQADKAPSAAISGRASLTVQADSNARSGSGRASRNGEVYRRDAHFDRFRPNNRNV